MTLEDRLQVFLGRKPSLGKQVFIAPGAVVLGDVTLGDYSSVWYHSVLRADINCIVVGHHTNIQDGCVLHLADELPCQVGNYVTIGHGAILHACTIADEVLIGMGAVIMDGAVVGKQCIVGARALITPGTQVPPGSLVLGVPGKVARKLSSKERKEFKNWARKYVDLAEKYASRTKKARPHLSETTTL
jgi:gamma-carbonic anhydrase